MPNNYARDQQLR